MTLVEVTGKKLIGRVIDQNYWRHKLAKNTEIKIQRLANISRSTANQGMKHGQLIGYKMKNIFLEKPYTKCGGETSSRPISKKLKLSMNLSLDQQSEHLYSFLLFYVKIEDYQNILKPLAFTSYEAFWKNKKRSRISLLASFSAWRLRGNISHVRFYQLTNFHCLVDFTFICQFVTP